MADARRVLLKSEAPNKTIFVVTDQQLLSWDGLRGSDDKTGDKGKAKAAPDELLSDDEEKPATSPW